MNLVPENNMERILNGEDVTPSCRAEYFVKQAIDNAGGGGETYETVAEIEVGAMEYADGCYSNESSEFDVSEEIAAGETYYFNSTANPSTSIIPEENAVLFNCEMGEGGYPVPIIPNKAWFYVVFESDHKTIVGSYDKAIENTTVRILKKVSGGGAFIVPITAVPDFETGDVAISTDVDVADIYAAFSENRPCYLKPAFGLIPIEQIQREGEEGSYYYLLSTNATITNFAGNPDYYYFVCKYNGSTWSGKFTPFSPNPIVYINGTGGDADNHIATSFTNEQIYNIIKTNKTVKLLFETSTSVQIFDAFTAADTGAGGYLCLFAAIDPLNGNILIVSFSGSNNYGVLETRYVLPEPQLENADKVLRIIDNNGAAEYRFDSEGIYRTEFAINQGNVTCINTAEQVRGAFIAHQRYVWGVDNDYKVYTVASCDSTSITLKNYDGDTIVGVVSGNQWTYTPHTA